MSQFINKSSNKAVNRFYYKGNVLETPKLNHNKTKNCFNKKEIPNNKTTLKSTERK